VRFVARLVGRSARVGVEFIDENGEGRAYASASRKSPGAKQDKDASVAVQATGLKALLAAAPLEDIDFARERDLGWNVAL
jgi:hypothetical protein